jgi:UDP-N-acetylglucosamine acyltransferase
MKGVYIAHDVTIRQSAVLSAGVKVAGHAIIGANTNMGMGAVVHQRCEVPHGCMIGMKAVITKKTRMTQNNCYVGNPARFLRNNIR